MQVDPETENFKKFFLSFSIIGTYLGAIVEQKYTKTFKYEHFYNTDLLTTIKRMIICFAVGIPALITLFISKDHSYWIVVIFK